MQRRLGLVLLASALAAGLGWLLLREPATQNATAPLEHEGRDAAGAGNAADSPQLSEIDPSEEHDPAPSPGRVSASDPPPSEEVKVQEIDEEARANALVLVRVVDASGEPRAGIPVQVYVTYQGMVLPALRDEAPLTDSDGGRRGARTRSHGRDLSRRGRQYGGWDRLPGQLARTDPTR